MEESQLIGQVVRYSITKEKSSEGTILDKVIMREKIESKEDKNKEQYVSVTGYLIQSKATNEIIPIAYWRLQAVINADGTQLILKDYAWEEVDISLVTSMPTGHLPGGYKRDHK